MRMRGHLHFHKIHCSWAIYTIANPSVPRAKLSSLLPRRNCLSETMTTVSFKHSKGGDRGDRGDRGTCLWWTVETRHSFPSLLKVASILLPRSCCGSKGTLARAASHSLQTDFCTQGTFHAACFKNADLLNILLSA